MGKKVRITENELRKVIGSSIKKIMEEIDPRNKYLGGKKLTISPKEDEKGNVEELARNIFDEIDFESYKLDDHDLDNLDWHSYKDGDAYGYAFDDAEFEKDGWKFLVGIVWTAYGNWEYDWDFEGGMGGNTEVQFISPKGQRGSFTIYFDSPYSPYEPEL